MASNASAFPGSTGTGTAPAVLLPIVQQHVDEVAMLRHVRSTLLTSNQPLHALRRLDERMAAHLDGIGVAGEAGVALLDAALEGASVGAVFAAAVLALQRRDAARLLKVVELASADHQAERGLRSALGWVSVQDLQGTVRSLLGSRVGVHRAWGLAACAMHRVDAGAVLQQAAADADVRVRAAAWLVAGSLGRRDMATAARDVLRRAEPDASGPAGTPSDSELEKQAAAWALTLWRDGADELVRRHLMRDGAPQGTVGGRSTDAAWRLALMAAPMDVAQQEVKQRAAAGAGKAATRQLLRMTGWVGDPQVAPWLIHHMQDDALARLAGEAFSLITGADLALLDLERKPPEGVEGAPNDNPEDENVAMDEDDSLPWPDPAKVQAWWQANAARFVPGQRYFAGAPPSPKHCIEVLKTKGQRQRIMAAEYLCLLRPGTKLFPVAAPAWRQSRWLAEEEAALS